MRRLIHKAAEALLFCMLLMFVIIGLATMVRDGAWGPMAIVLAMIALLVILFLSEESHHD